MQRRDQRAGVILAVFVCALLLCAAVVGGALWWTAHRPRSFSGATFVCAQSVRVRS